MTNSVAHAKMRYLNIFFWCVWLFLSFLVRVIISTSVTCAGNHTRSHSGGMGGWMYVSIVMSSYNPVMGKTMTDPSSTSQYPHSNTELANFSLDLHLLPPLPLFPFPVPLSLLCSPTI